MRIRKVLAVVVILISLVVAALLATVFVAFTSRDRDVLFGSSSSVLVDGRRRTYRLVGGGTDKHRLVVALHGYGGDSRQFAYYTALHNAFGADTVVVYPDAMKTGKSGERVGWNAKFCCGSGWKSGVDDVKFLDLLIKRVTLENHIASDRVFVVGFSNGAFMAERFATERPELLSAVAVVSGSIGTKTNSLRPSKPLPILLTHGAKDRRIPYEGGKSPSDPEFDWQSFSETVNAWKTANGCLDGAANASRTAGRVTTRYQHCEAALETIEYLNNGHVWDGWRLANVWARRPRASTEVARFFDEATAAR